MSGRPVPRRASTYVGVRLLADSIEKIIKRLPAVVAQPSPGRVRGYDDRHPVWVASDHRDPVAVITSADEELPSVQLGRDPVQLIGRLGFQYERSETDMASSSDGTASKRSQHKDLGMVAPRSADRRQLLLLREDRKAEHPTIEVD